MLMKALPIDCARALIVLSLLVGQSWVHLAVGDGHAHKVGGACKTARWRGRRARGERSRVGGTESEYTDQALECQPRKLTTSCCFHEALFSELLSELMMLGSSI